VPDERDLAEAKAFYGPLLGWSFERSGSRQDLSLATVDGVCAAGIVVATADAARPAGWLTFLATADIRADTDAVTAHGGRVLGPPQADGDRGSAAVACDPTGAPFGLWQAGAAIGTEHVQEPGCFAWSDLRTGDPQMAREFYAKVFGVLSDPLPAHLAGNEAYTTGYQIFLLADDRRPCGGSGPLTDPEAPFWLVYFQVRDLTEAVEFVESTGGRIDRRSIHTPFGRMAAVRDPLGNRLHLLQTPVRPPTLDGS